MGNAPVESVYARAVAAFKTDLIAAALIQNRGSVIAAAQQLGVSRTCLYALMHQLGITHTPARQRRPMQPSRLDVERARERAAMRAL